MRTNESDDEFQFASLDFEVDSLRVLTLYPPAQQVHCSLEHRTFASKPVYETLSYTWGPADPRKQIYVNGQRYLIRQNLYDALIHLQQDTPRALWVDAICIDQENTPERNSQVNLMPFIYTRASSVLVWLNLGLKKPQKQRDDDPPMTRLREMLHMEENRESIANLQYWTRVWVKQEYILPAQVKFLLDEFVLSEEDFYVLTNEMTQKPFADVIRTLKEHRENRHTESLRLERLIRTFRDSKCSETRDKIFGFLGLAHDNELEADYGMSYVELYTALINFHQDSEAELEDWRTANENDRAAKLMHFSELVQDALLGEVEFGLQAGAMFAGGPRTFTAKGATVSRILYIGPTYDEVVSSLNAEKAWRAAGQMHFGKYDVLADYLAADKKFTRSLLGWSQERVKSIRRLSATGSYAYRLHPDHDALAIRAAYNDISEASQPRRFLGTRGCFGMAPDGARVGDALACFMDCQSYVVLRPLGKDCWMIVGKAIGATVQFRGRSEFHVEAAVRDKLDDYTISVLREYKWDRGEGTFDERRNLINLQLDMHTLQQLTA